MSEEGEEPQSLPRSNAESMTRIRPEFPTGRVKKIMKLDKDINKVNSEALFLISLSTELFLQFLAEKSAEIATQKKRKIVKLDLLRLAVKNHQPTRDFLLDSLPAPTQLPDDKSRARPMPDKPAPPKNSRIDSFFTKPARDAPNSIHINKS